MFGCEYRDGRAESAPLLRTTDAQQVNNIGALEVLQHLKSKADIDKLYPQMVSPPEYGLHDLEIVSQAELWVVHE